MDDRALIAFDQLRQTQGALRALDRELRRGSGLAPQAVGWLADARALLAGALEPARAALHRPPLLPVLRPALDEVAQERWPAVIAAVARLRDEVARQRSPRDPLLEAVLSTPKWRTLKHSSKATPGFAEELRRRAGSGYVQRMLSDPTFAFAGPLLTAVMERLDDWSFCRQGDDAFLSEPEAGRAAEQLVAWAAEVELPMRQARLLAEAALIAPGRWETSPLSRKLTTRVRRRSRPAGALTASDTDSSGESDSSEETDLDAELDPSVDDAHDGDDSPGADTDSGADTPDTDSSTRAAP